LGSYGKKVSFLAHDDERLYQRQRAVVAVGGLRPQGGGGAVLGVPCGSTDCLKMNYGPMKLEDGDASPQSSRRVGDKRSRVWMEILPICVVTLVSVLLNFASFEV